MTTTTSSRNNKNSIYVLDQDASIIIHHHHFDALKFKSVSPRRRAPMGLNESQLLNKEPESLNLKAATTKQPVSILKKPSFQCSSSANSYRSKEHQCKRLNNSNLSSNSFASYKSSASLSSHSSLSSISYYPDHLANSYYMRHPTLGIAWASSDFTRTETI